MRDADILALLRDGLLHFRLEEILGNYQKNPPRDESTTNILTSEPRKRHTNSYKT